jgi:hypothetical protein
MTSIVAKIRARELGKYQTTSNFLVWFLNNITVSGTDLYKEQIYRIRDLLCYILELKFGFCMHLKDVTLKIVHEARMSLTNDSLPDILMEIIHVFEMEVYMKLFTVKDLYIPMHFFEMVKIFEMAHVFSSSRTIRVFQEEAVRSLTN